MYINIKHLTTAFFAFILSLQSGQNLTILQIWLYVSTQGKRCGFLKTCSPAGPDHAATVGVRTVLPTLTIPAAQEWFPCLAVNSLSCLSISLAAAACEFLDIVELLLQSGADPTLRDQDGCLPEEVTGCKAVSLVLQRHRASKAWSRGWKSTVW